MSISQSGQVAVLEALSAVRQQDVEGPGGFCGRPDLKLFPENTEDELILGGGLRVDQFAKADGMPSAAKLLFEKLHEPRHLSVG